MLLGVVREPERTAVSLVEGRLLVPFPVPVDDGCRNCDEPSSMPRLGVMVRVSSSFDTEVGKSKPLERSNKSCAAWTASNSLSSDSSVAEISGTRQKMFFFLHRLQGFSSSHRRWLWEQASQACTTLVSRAISRFWRLFAESESWFVTCLFNRSLRHLRGRTCRSSQRSTYIRAKPFEQI
jgi:hypothetical protein